MTFHSNPIEEVKQAVDIEQIISFYSGNEFRHGFMRCPFHNEKTASFSINKAKQIFKCFGCGKYSDSVGFVAEYLKCNQRQAAIQIDKDFNLGIFENNKTDYETIKKVHKLQKDKSTIDKRLNDTYILLANFVCDNRNVTRDLQTDIDYQIANDLSDVFIYGTLQEQMGVVKDYDRFIQRLRKYRR